MMVAPDSARTVQDEMGGAYDLPIRLYGMVEESIVDGPGLRFSVFVQGCTHRCPGCHNRESQSPDGGYEATAGYVCERIAACTSVSGVTLSGGEPFEQPEACLAIARWCKKRGLSVWAYSGYLYENLRAGDVRGVGTEEEHAVVRALLDTCDVLVDGPFVLAKQSYDLHWKGSSNQRVIDLSQTRACGRVVLHHEEELEFSIPENW